MISRDRYEESFSILSYETDFQGKLTLYALFNRFQDIAGIHAAYLKVGYQELTEVKLAWILSRIKVKIFSLPQWGENVRLATWPKGIDRLFALRDFCMTNEKREQLLVATSAWLLVDIEKGRPRRIDSLPIDLQFPDAEHAISSSLEKLQIPEGGTPVLEKPIWLSDLDINRHVNNAQYAKWITDCFPEEQIRNRKLESIQINYLEETILGDSIVITKMPNDIASKEYSLEGINHSKGSKVFHARVVME